MRAAAIHPHQPRFAQAITGVICLEAIIFVTPWAILAALALAAVNLFAPRYSPTAWLFRQLARPPRELEPAAPVRFSQMLAVVFLAVAALLFLAGLGLIAWIVVGIVAALALLSATTGICVGCEVYRFALARARSRDLDVTRELGLPGEGPWIVVLTAPGCTRCEPFARQLESAAGGRKVVRVDLSVTPAAAALPVRSVPAALAIARDGTVRAARAGQVAPAQIDEVLAAV